MRSAIRTFLHMEAASGIVLMLAAVAAVLVANSPVAQGYDALLHMKAGPLSVLHWINDALMALFFLLVGLEIKREFVSGHLARWSDRLLPFIAAAAGMAVPALLYMAFAGGSPGLAGGRACPPPR